MVKIKKLVGLCLAGLMIVSALVIPAAASEVQPLNNHDDRAFQFNFSGGGNWVTSFEQKLDDSDCYMYCEDTPYSYVGRVEAAADGGFVPINERVDVSHGYRYTFRSRTTHTLRNWAFDEYKPNHHLSKVYAAIVGEPQYTGTYTAYGVWSPDYDPSYS